LGPFSPWERQESFPFSRSARRKEGDSVSLRKGTLPPPPPLFFLGSWLSRPMTHCVLSPPIPFTIPIRTLMTNRAGSISSRISKTRLGPPFSLFPPPSFSSRVWKDNDAFLVPPCTQKMIWSPLFPPSPPRAIIDSSARARVPLRKDKYKAFLLSSPLPPCPLPSPRD